jgi:tetratricopeptide (TPR) repeat protein
VSAETPYTLRNLERMLGVGRNVVIGLVQAGYVTPARGSRNEFRFSFRDVVLLRAAVGLQAANVPQRKLLWSLRSLRAKLPESMPLSGLRITAVGDEVAVRDGESHWEAASGQLLLDLEVAGSSGSVEFMSHHASPVAKSAANWFEQGEAAESTDLVAAEAAYREALRLEPDHVYAYVNLGALLCEAGRCSDAVTLYDVAVRLAPDDTLVHYNRAIALEDLGRHREALASYERCLTTDPSFVDGHVNAARLCDRMGDAQGALRHFSAYRRLEKASKATTASDT